MPQLFDMSRDIYPIMPYATQHIGLLYFVKHFFIYLEADLIALELLVPVHNLLGFLEYTPYQLYLQIQGSRQIDRQIDSYIDRQLDRQIDRQIAIQIYRYSYIDRQIAVQIDILLYRYAYRQMNEYLIYLCPICNSTSSIQYLTNSYTYRQIYKYIDR